MSKRRLSKHQLARISQNQRKQLGRDEADSVDAQTSLEKCNGRIISHYGQHVDVESLLDDDQGRLIRCTQRSNLPKLVTGDLVVWSDDGADGGVILALGQRRNFFGRPSPEGQFKAIAANIDSVLVVFASSPTPHVSLIDRYLVAIEQLHLTAVLVLNKLDLLNHEELTELDHMLSPYRSIGYPLYKVSAEDGRGMPELEQALANQTTILVGQSGVGKSSLLNKLNSGKLADVAPLSATWARGTHTTTTSSLYHMRGFDLIDSPGIREFGLGHIDEQQVFDGFIEFRPFAGSCKFRDCSHTAEPDCAIQAALEAGQISIERVESYFRILDSLNELS
ncbi:MAG: small ribosomal subunit biogenesis GTPase RsgA [Gammaproteobacteria bacterium]|jgi:ribosome biogenesis GTPase|tara:strand:+ start:160 stop:1167 length:1008 start_codon:yes stop_codon:yes gene_type:complete